MKQMVCEMCGNPNLIKQDGFFVCQYCGCKYTIEEAKKLFVEGVVKIDNSDEIERLFQAARNAREASDHKIALKHYEAISAKRPNSWEALFYSVILKTTHIKNGEINSAAINVYNCLPKVFELIASGITEEKQRKAAVKQVVHQCKETSHFFTTVSYNFYACLSRKEIDEHHTRSVNIANIMLRCGNMIEKHFNMSDSTYQQQAAFAWKYALHLNECYCKSIKIGMLFKPEAIIKYANKIRVIDSTYICKAEKRNQRLIKLCYIFSILTLVSSLVPVLGLVLSALFAFTINKRIAGTPEAEKNKRRTVVALIINGVITVVLGPVLFIMLFL